MRKILVTILIFILCVTLCVNFVRFMLYNPNSSLTEDFSSVSFKHVLQAFTEFDLDSTPVLSVIGVISQRFLDMGENFTSMFAFNYKEGKNIFEVVKGFFLAFGKSFVAFIDLSGLIIALIVVVGKFLLDAVFSLFKFLNTILGLDLVTGV